MYYGDIPPDHLESLQELKILEEWFYEYGSEISPLAASKGFVSMSHDYFQMEMEEKGDELLMIAERHTPGYFKGPIKEHRVKDKDFDRLVTQLSRTMGLETMQLLGFSDE